MTFKDLLAIVRARLVTVIVCLVLGVGGAGAYLALIPTTYSATATAYVSVQIAGADSANTGTFFSASQLANQKAQAFAAVITSNAVAQRAQSQLDLSGTPSDIAASILAVPVQNSSTIRVQASAHTPEGARTLADEIVKAAAHELHTLEGADSPVQLRLLSSAELAAVSAKPVKVRVLALGILGGLLLGIAAAVIRSLLDRRIRRAEDITRVTEVPVLASLPMSDSIGRQAKAPEKQDFHSSEAMRKFRTNLKFADIDSRVKVCVISSPNQFEGKSSVALQLAKVMAAAGEDVVLIDGDLRRPTLAQTFNIDDALGLSQVLAGSITLDRALKKTGQPGLFVLPAGQIPPNPSELLGSQRMAELISALSEELFVILDAPPLLPVTDAAVLSRLADGLLLVVRSGNTNTDEMKVALSNVEQVGGKVLGIVLNGIPTSKTSRLKYGGGAYAASYSSYESREGKTGRPTDFDLRTLDGNSPSGAVGVAHASASSPLEQTGSSVADASQTRRNLEFLSEERSVPLRRRPHFKPITPTDSSGT